MANLFRPGSFPRNLSGTRLVMLLLPPRGRLRWRANEKGCASTECWYFFSRSEQGVLQFYKGSSVLDPSLCPPPLLHLGLLSQLAARLQKVHQSIPLLLHPPNPTTRAILTHFPQPRNIKRGSQCSLTHKVEEEEGGGFKCTSIPSSSPPNEFMHHPSPKNPPSVLSLSLELQRICENGRLFNNILLPACVSSLCSAVM